MKNQKKPRGPPIPIPRIRLSNRAVLCQLLHKPRAEKIKKSQRIELKRIYRPLSVKQRQFVVLI